VNFDWQNSTHKRWQAAAQTHDINFTAAHC